MKKKKSENRNRNKNILTCITYITNITYILLIAPFAVAVLGIKNISLIVDAINQIKIV